MEIVYKEESYKVIGACFQDSHRSQVYNSLKATGYRLGLLVNFGAKGKLEYERIVS